MNNLLDNGSSGIMGKIDDWLYVTMSSPEHRFTGEFIPGNNIGTGVGGGGIDLMAIKGKVHWIRTNESTELWCYLSNVNYLPTPPTSNLFVFHPLYFRYPWVDPFSSDVFVPTAGLRPRHRLSAIPPKSQSHVILS